MSTSNLRTAVDNTSPAGHAHLGQALLGLRTFCTDIDRAVRQLLMALADPEATGDVDLALVGELLDNPETRWFLTQYLHSHRTPDSAHLIAALTEELAAAATAAQPESTVPEEWSQ